MDGYKVIDLKNTQISTTATTIAGVYEAIKTSDKAILLVGINYSGTQYKPAYVTAVPGTNKYDLYTGVIQIEVDKDSKVKVINP